MLMICLAIGTFLPAQNSIEGDWNGLIDAGGVKA